MTTLFDVFMFQVVSSLPLAVYAYYQGFLTLLKFDTNINSILLAVMMLFITDFKANGFAKFFLPPLFVVTIVANIVAYFGVVSSKTN